MHHLRIEDVHYEEAGLAEFVTEIHFLVHNPGFNLHVIDIIFNGAWFFTSFPLESLILICGVAPLNVELYVFGNHGTRVSKQLHG